MFYISLPYFYENFKFNQFFKNYVNNCNHTKNDKLIEKFNIEYAYGSFPWSYWNGGINNHQGAAVLAPQMQLIIAQTDIPLRIDMSNIYIQAEDYYDIHENAILKVLNGTNSSYEISNTNLMEYISLKNLDSKFIISSNTQLLEEFNTNTINKFYGQQQINLINIGYNPFIQLENFNLNEIKDKNKLEVSIGYCQNCSLKEQLKCINTEQKSISCYSNKSLFIDCPFRYQPIDYYTEIKPYLNNGIKHFKFITNLKNLKDFNINIIKSFVKPEYQGECINEYYRTISK